MIVVTWSTTERREKINKSTGRIRIIQTSSGNVNFHYTSLLQLLRYKSTAHWYNPNFFGKCKFPLGIFLFIFIGTNQPHVGIIQTSSGNVNFHFSIFFIFIGTNPPGVGIIQNSSGNVNLYCACFIHLHMNKSIACWYNRNFFGKCKFPFVHLLFIFIGKNPPGVGIIQTSSGNVNFHSASYIHLHRYKSTARWYNEKFLGKCKFPSCILNSSSKVQIHRTLV